MIILGIDPGIERTGWGVIQKHKSTWIKLDYGCIFTMPHTSTSSRLVTIFEEVTKLAIKFQPTTSAVENLFYSRNAKTAMIVGQARGVVMLALEMKHIPVMEINPMTVKLAVTGYGSATKDQVQKMVKAQLKLDEIPKPDDIADALAVALAASYKSLKHENTRTY